MQVNSFKVHASFFQISTSKDIMLVKHDFFRYAAPYADKLVGSERQTKNCIKSVLNLDDCDKFSATTIMFCLPIMSFSVRDTVRHLIKIRVLSEKKRVADWEKEFLEILKMESCEYFNGSREQVEAVQTLFLGT